MSDTPANSQLPFGKRNYIFLVVSILTVVLGFFLLSVGDFVDATQFSVALHIAPVVIIGGFVAVIYAIIVKPEA